MDAAPPARGLSETQAFAEAALRVFPDFTYEIREPLCVAADGTRRVARMLMCFDVIEAAEQLLGIRLRPPRGSWRKRTMLSLQRAAVARARRFGRA